MMSDCHARMRTSLAVEEEEKKEEEEQEEIGRKAKHAMSVKSVSPLNI